MLKNLLNRMLVAAALCLSLAFPATAGQVPPPMPEQFDLHVSIASPDHLLESLDGAASRVTDGTRYMLPPGILTMLASMYLPLPAEGWDREGQLDFVANFDTRPSDMAFILTAGSIDEFLQALEEEGVESELDEEANAYRTTIPGLGACVVGQAANNRLVVAESPGMFEETRKILEGWQPEFWGKGQFTVDLNLPKDWSREGFLSIYRAIDQLSEVIEEDKEGDFDRAKEVSLNPEVVKGFAVGLVQVLPEFLDEAAKLNGLAFDVDISEERIGVETRFRFDEPSLAGKMAMAAAKRSNLESPMIRLAGTDAASITVTAPPEAVLPGLGADVRRIALAFLGNAFPEMRDDIESTLATALACEVGENASATYYRENCEYYATWMKAKDAQGLLEQQVAAVELFNQMVKKTVLDEQYLFSIEIGRGTLADGAEYVSMRLNPANRKVFDFLAMKLAVVDPVSMPRLIQMLENFRQYIGLRDNTLVIVNGLAEEDDFVRALNAVNGQDKALADLPAAHQALEALQHSQDAVSLINFDQANDYLAWQLVQNLDLLDRTDMYSKALSEIMRTGGLIKSGDMAALSFGEAGEMLTTEASLPIAAINTLLKNYEKMAAIIQGPEMDEEDDVGAEEEEEEIEVEEPVNAT